MNTIKRQSLVIVLSASLIIALLLLISLDSLFMQSQPELVTLREIQISTPPPPPPPSPSSSPLRSADPVMELDVLTTNSPISILNLEFDIDIPLGELSGQGPGQWDDDLSIDWEGISLSQLDAVPRLLNSPVQNFPNSFLKKGVKQFNVDLHILIDEEGRAYLIRVLENPYPEINASLEDYVSKMRYTPPTSAGVVTKAEFRKPVEFQLW